MYQGVQPAVLADRFGQLGQILIAGDVALEDRGGAQLGTQLGDGFLLAFSLIGQQQFRAFASEGLGDGVGETPLVRYAQNQRGLPREQFRHELLF